VATSDRRAAVHSRLDQVARRREQQFAEGVERKRPRDTNFPSPLLAHGTVWRLLRLGERQPEWPLPLISCPLWTTSSRRAASPRPVDVPRGEAALGTLPLRQVEQQRRPARRACSSAPRRS
jgi:hypothetical protein